MRARRPLMTALAVLLALVAGACSDSASPPSRASASLTMDLPPIRTFPTRAALPPQRSNADMARDFLDLHFRLEGGTEMPVLTRFETPVGVTITGSPTATLRPDLEALLSRLRNEAGLDIRRLPTGTPAAITIEAVNRSRIQRLLPQAACFVVANVSSLDEYRRTRRQPQTNWKNLRSRTRLAIFVPNDVSPQELRDCLHEELAQALGPLNDLYRLPDSVFNDDNVHTVLTGFDMLMLRATYDPALKTGMSRAEVAARLPAILARLNPAGQRRASAPLPETPRSWGLAVETALGGYGSGAMRIRAAHEAARIARDLGWRDHRRAFGHFLIGRAIQDSDPTEAEAHFRSALTFLGGGPDTAGHRALVQSRLASFALRQGKLKEADRLIAQALPAATAGQNAALMSTLLVLKAHLAEARGQKRAASSLRSESLGWALYGNGVEATVKTRLREVAAARP
ncbi:Protein of unknown function (DUF2927) [Tritonibacter scottomollicae]|uniref:ATP-dependent transcriptional regulator n=2 Tax=Tritonibacter scottomollicae TaxID=483013 RepID=A0A2T1ACZ2_TRISK|nr:Protein of unknown function (DUF2927) [Tritonibacter scottomollicae]